MPRTLSLTALQSALAQETEEVWVTLIDLYSSSWNVSSPNTEIHYRYCNNTENVTSNGSMYLAYPFQMSLVAENEDSTPTGQLVISAVDQTLAALFRSVSDKPRLTISVVLASDPNTILYGPVTMEALSFDLTAERISVSLGFDPIAIEPFPYLRFTPRWFPKLF